LIEAVVLRYKASTHSEKKQILDESIQVDGYHRKHAIWVLRNKKRPAEQEPKPRARLYDEPVWQALLILWEAADRICGKRLKAAIPSLLDAMERHGHIQLDTEVRRRLLAIGNK